MASEHEYTVVIERGEDSGFVAVCSPLGVVSQGATRDEAIANVREAMTLAVEDFRDLGEPLPMDTGATTEHVSIAV
jgi:predicted RNase H-like HicB family nuclease